MKKDDRPFVALLGGGFVCPDCLPREHPPIDLGHIATSVWRQYTSGWTAPPICSRCRLAIPVYVDASEPD